MKIPTHDRGTRAAGFTLVELLIGLAVLAVLLSLGIPGFASIIQSNRLSSETNDLITALNLARSEASKRGLRVSVCGLDTAGTNCATTPSWANGWIVFTDDVGTIGNVDGPGDVVVQRWPSTGGGFTFNSPTTSAYVGFLPTRAESAATLEVYKAGCAGENKRRIEVASPGRISLSRVTC
jgi:type IV fimbrial biogenesis protein FimT